jgi:hypothetical protein
MAKEQGLSLLDIGPVTENIEVGPDKFLAVTGISARGVLTLFLRFPSVQGWFAGESVNGAVLVGLAPEALAAIIAAGTGNPGDDKAEEIASNLPVELQLDIVEVIGRLTFKKGFGPFVERVVSLANSAATSANLGKAASTILPQQSKPLSPTDTTQPASGTTPPDK